MSFLTGLAGEALKALFASFFTAIFGEIERREQYAARERLGRTTAERDQAIEGRKAAERIAKAAVRVETEDDVIARMERGEG
jgi:hypothetical protein